MAECMVMGARERLILSWRSLLRSAATEEGVSAEHYVEAAGNAAQAGDRRQAVMLLLEAVNRFDSDEKPTHATAALRAAERWSGFDPALTERLGTRYRERGEVGRAAAAFEEAARRSSTLGRHRAARKLYAQARAADPSRPEPWLYFANLAGSGGDLETAVRVLERGVAVAQERGVPRSAEVLAARLRALKSELAALPEAEILESEDGTAVIPEQEMRELLEAFQQSRATAAARAPSQAH